MYYSQYKQDKIMNDLYFNNKKNGVFIELGALDGIKYSNTYFFEKHLNWTGLCIEPNPFDFSQLEKNRNCIKENFAISNEETIIDFLAIEGEGAYLSGIVENYDDRHKKRIKKSGEVKGKKHLLQKQSIKLQKLIEKHFLFNIDYFSLDVEGSELSVLQSIDFSKTRIEYFTIENNYRTNEVERFLEKHNYELIRKIDRDDVYKLG